MPFWTLRPPDEGDLRYALGRMEGKLDAFLRRFEDVAGTQSKHDDRLNRLEHAHTRLKTTTWLVATGVSLCVPIVLKYLNLV